MKQRFKTFITRPSTMLGGAMSRAALALLMMLLTTASAWATDVTVTYKISVSGTIPKATITNAATGAPVCTWDNGIYTLWPANVSHVLNDQYQIKLTPNHDLDKTDKNEYEKKASTTAFRTEQTTRFTVNVGNSQYYLKSVTFKEDDTEKASLEVEPNNSYGNVTVSGNKFFNYITVELTTDRYYLLTPSGSLSITTTPARTYNNANYFVAGTDITIEPTNASCIVESVSGVNNATIAADKRSFSFAMPAGNISPSASLTEVYQVSPASGITLSPAAYFTYDGAKYYKPNTTITLSSNVPTGQHVTYKASYNNGNKTLTGNTYTVNSTDRDVTLTALLENNTYYVAFNGNGSTAGSMSNQAFTYGTSQNLAANAFTRTGYTFVGWAMSENGDVVYSNQQSVSNLITTDGGTLTLYAQWTANTYTVHFDAGDDQYAKMGETVTISTSGVTVPEGYTCNGIIVTPTVDVTDNGNGTYSFTMPADDVTVNVVFAPIYDWATVNQGTEDDPYMIYDKAQLLLLAYRVNGTHGQTANDYRGTWFKLGADIKFDYDPNEGDDYAENYEAIGGYHNGNLCNFKGHFDGQNHTVSGIRLRKDGTDANNMYQGLFGRMVPGAEIQRVHVTDARIKGRWYVSGIIGYLDGGTVRNCTVTESTFTANSSYGTICGSDAGGALRYNYYRHCTVNGTAVLSGMGCRGKDVTTTDGAMPMYVPYIDADGKEQRCIDYKQFPAEYNSELSHLELTATTLNAGEWYVVDTNINLWGIDDVLTVNGNGAANIILCDGKRLDYETYDGNIQGSLNIYGQSKGTGVFKYINYDTNAGKNSLIDGNLTIYGGSVTIEGSDGAENEYACQCAINGSATIYRGSLYAKGGDHTLFSGKDAIHGNVYFHGGSLTAIGGSKGGNDDCYDGWGIYGKVSLDWSSASDRFKANRYGDAMTIADGKAFADEDGNIYSGTLNYTQVGALAEKTLTPAIALADNADNSSAIATAATACTGDKTLAVQLSGRTLWKDGAWNTLCLPFGVSTTSGPLSGDNVTAMVLRTSDSGLSGTTLTLNFDDATTIPAGTPFIIRWGTPEDNPGTTLTDPVFTGVTVESGLHNFVSTDGKVTFKGTYGPQSWNGEDRSVLFLGEDNQLHWPLAGANINACRAYFQLAEGQQAHEFVLNFGDGSEELSGVKEVKEVKEVKDNTWYDLSGSKLDGKPTKKGLYIHNGRKIVVK